MADKIASEENEPGKQPMDSSASDPVEEASHEKLTPELSAEESISTNNPPQNTDMEVHHHSGHHHPKKRFKDYLLEGLMIFVAVSVGFLAENLREIISDKEKEHQYMSSYLKNLQDDSAKLRECIELNIAKLQTLDTLMLFSKKDLSTPTNRIAFYDLGSNVDYHEFKSNDATLLQLTNSGGLRLIKKDHVADSIAKYAAEIKDVYAAEAIYASAITDATNSAQEIFDQTVLFDSSYFKGGNPTGKLIPFLSQDPAKLKMMFNKKYFERGVTLNYINTLKSLVPFQTRFITYLHEQYPH